MDKEKLLAARKKLKEYQLHKKDNSHEHHNNLKNNNGTQEKHMPIVASHEIQNNERKSSPPIEEFEKKQSVPDISSSMNDLKNEAGSNQFINTMTHNLNSAVNIYRIDCDENESNKQTVFERNALIQKENNQYKPADVSHVHIPSNNIDMVFNQSQYQDKSYGASLLNDSSILQKEHLLQMASSVAEALVDDNESSEVESLSNLIDKNQFLTTCLQEQTKLINQLQGEVSRHSSRVSELEAILTAKDAEFEAKILQEINPLKKQLQLQTHSIGILVAEKAELNATITQCYTTIKQKTELIEDLSGKLKSHQLHVAEFEKETADFKCSSKENNRAYQELLQNYEKLTENFTELRKEKEDLEFETSELKQKLNFKNTEVANLQQNLQEKNGLLSLNEIRIQQLTNSSQQIQSLENGHQTAMVFEQQLNRLKDALTSLNNEKEEASVQYQNYVRELDERHKKLNSELDAASKQIKELESREQSYIQRLVEMEQLLQREREQMESLKPLLDHKDRIETLTKNIDNLVMEQESLQLALTRKDAEIEMLNKELHEYSEMKEQNLDAAKLALALESEQLGASRAISQNQQLKQQLNEMHDAFVLLSNNKLDLTEELQAERSLSKKLTLQLENFESEVKELKNQIKEKEASLIELEKEKLCNIQIADTMQHYEARSHSSYTLQQELQNAQILIENLKKDNKQLKEELNVQKHDMDFKNNKFKDNDEQSLSVSIIHENELNELVSMETQTSQEELFDIPEPLKKLEIKFKETIDKVAELADEKQRLEHIVLQLQGETETIGEYVTLYQKQRAILQEKAKEREQSFRKISEQCNYQQEQLHRLKVLVSNLIKKKSVSSTNTVNTIESVNLSCVDTKENIEEIEKNCRLEEITDPQEIEKETGLKDDTTSEIINLLSEIKDCSDTCILEPNFHPCPWCSGKLITV